MRKLASIKKIDSIEPIEGADFIELAVIGGWNAVIKKGVYAPNDLIVYFEIDSLVPEHLAPFLSASSKAREYDGVKCFRLKTKKLKGVFSQGLVMPLSDMGIDPTSVSEDDDVSELLGVKKYEKPLPGQNNQGVKDNFPEFLRKTDQVRIQNIKRDFNSYRDLELSFQVTEKLDGTSLTIYKNNDIFGVCSRNYDLEDREACIYWDAAKRYDLENIFSKSERNLAVQGELIGEGIQGNQYHLQGRHFYVFSLFDIDAQKYLAPSECLEFCAANGLNHSPVISENFKLTGLEIFDIIKDAEGDSLLNKSEREGLVYKCNTDTNVSFKAISNNWLIKNEK